MSSILNELDREELEQKAQAERDYKSLVRKEAADKLTAKDKPRVAEVKQLLGVSGERMKQDVATLKKVAALTAAIAPRAEIDAEIAACAKESAALNDRRAKAEEEHNAHVAGINTRHAAAQDRQTVVNQAAAQLTDLQNTHAELLELPDPAVEGRKKHLVQVVFGQPANPTHSLIEFESIMADSQAQAITLRHDSDTIWIPVDGQSEAELQQLLALARQLMAGGKPARYILPNTESERPKCCTNVVLYADLSRRLNADQKIFVNEYNWIPAPGQSLEELEKCVSAITRKEQVRTDNVTTVILEPNQTSSWATIPRA